MITTSCGGKGGCVEDAEIEYATAEGLAVLLVNTMDQGVADKFAQVAADAKKFKRGHIQVAAGMIKSHVEQLFTPECRATWQIPSTTRRAKQHGSSKEETENCCTQTEKLSEDNKEHLKVIVAAQISDMMPGIQRLVASDPRIQRFSLSNSPKFKEQIIKVYKAELAARRKSEIALLRAASKLSQANVSSQAYRAIRNILVEMGFKDVLPTVKDLDEARNTIEDCATEDLVLTATEDGWFVSPTAVIELDLLRRMEMASVKNTRFESGGRLIGNSGPGMHGWQDERIVKITLDARSITKKTSQTEVTMQVFDEGKAGEADSHRALGLRTVGIWMGKDSREKVQANATNFLKEIQQLAEYGVVFNMEKQTFLGQSEEFRKLPMLEQQAVWGDRGEKKYCPVKIKFVFAADMAAQCAVIGHGCAGNHYCAHCMAHEKDRHLPYVLVTTDEETTLQAMAHRYDMHARTLYAINTRQDHKGVQILTVDGLRNSTAMDAAAREAAVRADMQREAEADNGSRRQSKKAKKVPVTNSGPDEKVLKQLVGWREAHPLECSCDRCAIPKGTCVRVIPNFGFSRPSDFLREHCPSITAEMCPFCALHCNMRVTETLFHQICQAALTSSKSKKLIECMNTALQDLGINRRFKESLVTGKYEKLSFEGHQALDLLATDADGKMGIQRVLDAMWPGAAEDTGVGRAYGIEFVPRTIEVWRQWAVVVKLMSERFSENLKKDVVDGEDGFARFGKECREFIFRFQSMSTVDYSKSYYLHTLLHHAGDFMRALQNEGLTLGMMSNSGAERRHEYGRRASRKALASNGWRKKRQDYANRPNLLVYLTVKEVLMFEYGKDLVSHEIARLSMNGDSPGTSPLLPGRRVDWQVQSRRELLSDSDKESLPLLSEEELREEFEAGPNALPPSFETSNNKIWGERGKKKAFALIGLKIEDENGESDSDLKSFDPDLQGILFDGQPVYVTDDESVAGSEEDMQFHDDLTVNSFDFPEQDEDEDESYAILEGAEEHELAVESLEWVTEMTRMQKLEEGETVHDANDRSALRRFVSGYPRVNKPTRTSQAAAIEVTDSRLVQAEAGVPLMASCERRGAGTGQPSVDTVVDQPFQPAVSNSAMNQNLRIFVGSTLDMGCADSCGARRPAQAKGRRGPGRGGRRRGEG